ncbi:MAG: hypothetical protein MJZ20_02225 [Bacteroidaceae bacterium]|nr:hypothetical protein [Bacteroidaceae bacterium]
MNSLVSLIEKFEYEIRNNKGHGHLYDRFDQIMSRLKSGEGKTDDEQRALESVISTLAFEGTLFTGVPRYNYYVVRCYICASKLFDFIHNEYRIQYLQPQLDDLFVKLKERHLLPYFPNDFFTEHTCRLLDEDKFDSVLESIRQCFECSDAGRRPHVYDNEKEMYDNFVRGYKLTKKYLARTHDYERYAEWFKILSPTHVGDILAEIPEDSRWDDVADLIDETLTLQIEMLEDWKRNSYKTFMACGGEELLSRCLEY